MMRHIVIGLGVALASVFAVVGLSAPANASGYVLYKTYGQPEACSSAGFAGQQSGQWKFYYCDEISPPSASGPGLIDLYVSY